MPQAHVIDGRKPHSILNEIFTSAGIGTICHEFSPCLGFADMYDTTGGDGYGIFSELVNGTSWLMRERGIASMERLIGIDPAAFQQAFCLHC